MLHYRDMTYCWSDCINTSCDRKVTKVLQTNSDRRSLPLSMSDFSGTCDIYQPPETTTNV